MDNKLRTDITIDKSAMTKEQLEAYDSFIDCLAELCRESMARKKERENQVLEESVE